MNPGRLTPMRAGCIRERAGGGAATASRVLPSPTTTVALFSYSTHVGLAAEVMYASCFHLIMYIPGTPIETANLLACTGDESVDTVDWGGRGRFPFEKVLLASREAQQRCRIFLQGY